MARITAERIRSEIEQLRVRHDSTSIAMTVSIGLASRQNGESVDDLLRRADEALYEAKNKGRNRVVDYSSLVGDCH